MKLLDCLLALPPVTLDELQCRVDRIQASIDLVEDEIESWRDQRLQPFMRALGRLLAIDVLRHPHLSEQP